MVLDAIAHCASGPGRKGELPGVAVASCDHADSVRSLWQGLALDLAKNEAAKPSRSADTDGTVDIVRPAVAGAGVGAGAALHAAALALRSTAGAGPDGAELRRSAPVVVMPSASERLLRSRAAADSVRARASDVTSVAELARHLRATAPPSATTFLLIDSAHRLAELDPSAVAALLRLPELTHRAVCPVLITSSAPAVLGALDRSDRRPLAVRLRAPTPAAVAAAVAGDVPEGAAPAVFAAFSRHVTALFTPLCGRRIDEISYCARTLWPGFVASLAAHGGDARDDAATSGAALTSALRASQPDALRLRTRLFHHDAQPAMAASAASTQPELSSATAASSSSLAATAAPALPRTAPEAQLLLPSDGVELPYITKFVLLAAFAASCNPPDLDTRFFARGGSGRSRKQRRSRRSAAKRAKDALQHVLGPRSFPLDRLLCITHALLGLTEGQIAAEGVSTGSLQSELATLVSLNLVERASASAELDAPKFRCIAGKVTVDAVASSTGVELHRFVYDPERHA